NRHGGASKALRFCCDDENRTQKRRTAAEQAASHHELVGAVPELRLVAPFPERATREVQVPGFVEVSSACRGDSEDSEAVVCGAVEAKNRCVPATRRRVVQHARISRGKPLP